VKNLGIEALNFVYPLDNILLTVDK
jgi:hypothetical protein